MNECTALTYVENVENVEIFKPRGRLFSAPLECREIWWKIPRKFEGD